MATSFRTIGGQRAGWSLLAVALTLGHPGTETARADSLRFTYRGKPVEHVGNIVGRFANGILFETRDTRHFIIKPDEILAHHNKDHREPLFTRQQLAGHLRTELGATYNILTTGNYIIAYTCEPEYARQAGELLEHTRSMFIHTLRNKGGFQFTPPVQPLIAVIFGSRDEYLRHVSEDSQDAYSWTSGVYLQQTNRIYFYQRSSVRAAAGGRTGVTNLATPIGANGRGFDPANVEIVVHEGVHQIGYNLGIHRRYADQPTWLVEGLATYFEASDPEAKSGWSGAGRLNDRRLHALAQHFEQLPKGFLTGLVTEDAAFANAAKNDIAYSAAWALTYFAMNTAPRSYVKYLRLVGGRPHYAKYSTEQRLADFKQAFGRTPDDWEVEFRRYFAPYVSQFRAGTRANR